MDRVHLRIGSRQWSAWSEVSIERSIERVAGSAVLAVSGVDWASGEWLVPVPSMPCEVRIGETWKTADPVLTGYVDGDEVGTQDGSVYRLQVRSRTADAVDCSVDPSSSAGWHGATVEQIAGDLCDPYDIDVVADVPTGSVVSPYRVDRSRSVAKAIEPLCRERGLLLTDDELGHLLITSVPAPGAVADVLERGRNIEQLQRTRSVTDRYSRYVVRGQSTIDIAGEGTVDDAWMGRNRTLTVNADKSADSASCLRRAMWEAMIRAGKSIRYTATVGSWRMASGKLWRPNTLVRLVDSILGIDDEVLISGIQLVRSVQSGTRATLTLTYPDAYLPEPIAANARHYRRKAITADAHAVTGWFGPTVGRFGDPNEEIR